MDRRRKGESGLSLVELLVVLGIIAIISAVSIPLLARAGLFTSSKADLAARELFTVLRAAKIYATTHNVETAVAYGGRIVQDSFSGETVPVVDSMAIVRRLKRNELLLHAFTPRDEIFVPLGARDGGFKTLPNRTCILPDVFAVVEINNNTISATGLRGVLIWDPIDGLILSPRSDPDPAAQPGDVLGYALSTEKDEFPAHRFSPEGALLADDRLPQQRLRLRVGLLPDADISDRFFVDPEEAELREPITVVFSEAVQFPVLKLADGTPIDIDVDIFLYVATGRVKVGS